ncbi:MAG: VTC domain-containing protein [Magnetococcales bacterium]|nr:VTC domain-containing protein [Magnetococcales bacterium]
MERFSDDLSRGLAFRYERKFFISDRSVSEVDAWIRRHPAFFRTAHPPRHNNNIYFDGIDYQSYFDNVDGLADRIKIRVRWYGDLLGTICQPRLEVKIKRGHVGTKAVFPLNPLFLPTDSRFDLKQFQNVLKNSNLPVAVLQAMKSVVPVLMNRYHRHYHISADGRFRLTLDSGFFYKRMERFSTLGNREAVQEQHLVMELKYAPDLDSQARKITEWFPFRVTKSSKYVEGVDRVFAHEVRG